MKYGYFIYLQNGRLRAGCGLRDGVAPPPEPQRVPAPLAARFCPPAAGPGRDGAGPGRAGQGRAGRGGAGRGRGGGTGGRGRSGRRTRWARPPPYPLSRPRASRCDWRRPGGAGLERDQSTAAGGGCLGGMVQPSRLPTSLASLSPLARPLLAPARAQAGPRGLPTALPDGGGGRCGAGAAGGHVRRCRSVAAS